ncbi:piggyBac transposable element-derived protein 4-like [Vanessa cardui]|uniref:piggyBac transposable element-derived protein 4-like n=1 Tax=Vanessa cardui TaxID=171605 RepID=UPI001F147632|nr:piggyBac transposable element-derived protein 4-like [Vanessa cardui]
MLILRCLHFSSEISTEDRLAKIRPIVDHFNKKMNEIYYPGKQLSLDESMVLWCGRLQFRQYIKNKRHKYGIKLYVLAEPEGTVLKFQIYGGAGDDTSGIGHTQKIVLKLLEDKLDSGHSVYMDNYYNSYDLATKLLDRQTYCTGILNKNRKGNPIDLATVTLRKGENKSLFLNGVHIGKWRDKRYVLYISTEHDNEMMEVTDKRGNVIVKPAAIIHYNKFMSGVDLQDQMVSYYPCERKTMRWYKNIFIHTLQMSVRNSSALKKFLQEAKKRKIADCSPDGIFEDGIIEMKCPVNEKNYVKNGQATEKYNAQMQIQMYGSIYTSAESKRIEASIQN